MRQAKILILILLVLVLALLAPCLVFADTAGPKGGAGFFEGRDGESSWVSLDELEVEDGICATSDMTSVNLTNSLQVTNFGFVIPEGAAVVGMKVEIKRSRVDNGGHCKDLTVQVIGGSEVGDNKATATDWPTSLAYASYVGSSDLWGAMPTVEQINGDGFGVTIQAQDANSLDVAQVDYVRMTVYYTLEPSGSPRHGDFFFSPSLAQVRTLSAALRSDFATTEKSLKGESCTVCEGRTP